MRAGVSRRHLLQGLLAGGLLGLPAPEPPPAPAAPEPPRCRCPRAGTYAAYGGNGATVPVTLTYPCPRCGQRVVEYSFRMAEAWYPYSAAASYSPPPSAAAAGKER
jgi:hypothetical protein